MDRPFGARPLGGGGSRGDRASGRARSWRQPFKLGLTVGRRGRAWPRARPSAPRSVRVSAPGRRSVCAAAWGCAARRPRRSAARPTFRGEPRIGRVAPGQLSRLCPCPSCACPRSRGGRPCPPRRQCPRGPCPSCPSCPSWASWVSWASSPSSPSGCPRRRLRPRVGRLRPSAPARSVGAEEAEEGVPAATAAAQAPPPAGGGGKAGEGQVAG